MRILYLSQRVPFPPDRGDKIPSYNAIRYLSRRHDVTAACLADSEADMANGRSLRDVGVNTIIASHPAPKARLQALQALPGTVPLSVAYFRSKDLLRRVSEAHGRMPFDAVVASSSSMAPYADALPGVPLLADLVDLDSQKWALYARFSPWPWSSVYHEEGRRLLEYERSLTTRAYRILVRTRAELEDCQRLLPPGPFDILANGVDADYFRRSQPRRPSSDIVFTGVMDYFPNVQGVTWFCDHVFPRIRRAVPEATFTIVGARPSRSVRRLGRRPGVVVTGRVPDVRPYLERAAVAVAPLHLARGIQNKVLEALAMETPAVISTPAAAGIDAPEGEGFRTADDPLDFASAVLLLLQDPERARTLGQAGQALVERAYVWDRHLRHLEALLSKAVDSGIRAASVS